MANIAIFRINYKSDFILTLNSDAGWMTPFCIKFWTGAPSQAFFVGWDGTTYTHCSYDPSEPTKLVVQFDDHHLPIGDLKFQIAYHFTVADFPNDTEDEVINTASITTEIDGQVYQVMLDFTGETAPEIEFSLPAYANEAQRIANEEQRIADEQTRIDNEAQRIQNEETRINQEQTRQDNEAQRIRNEQTRINQEEARVREFATLKHDAQEATTAANDAAALANQKAQLAVDKAQLAADKAALAQDAATLANEKAQLATDKAALANDAAALANEKAALAQQKAEYAKDQGDYAKQQGDYAKEQGDYAKRKGDDAAAQMQQQAQAFSEAQAARQTAYEQAEGTESGSEAGDGSRWGTFKANEAARDAKVDAKVADITNLQKAVAEGAVYDISANHLTEGVPTKYADLTAALGANGVNVPVDKRKGGMSVKFVQSSDNKYVQYRYMLDDATTVATFINPDNWQGVDSEPVDGSKNLVESGGVEGCLFALGGYMNYVPNKKVNSSDGKILDSNDTYISARIPAKQGDTIYWSYSDAPVQVFLGAYSEDGFINYINGVNGFGNRTVQLSGATYEHLSYIIATFEDKSGYTPLVKVNDVVMWDRKREDGRVTLLEKKTAVVDAEPIFGSDNLVKSNGIAEAIAKGDITSELHDFLAESNYYINSGGIRNYNTQYEYAIIPFDYIAIDESSNTGIINALKSDKSFSRNIANWKNLEGIYKLNEDEKYFCVSYIKVDASVKFHLCGAISDINAKIKTINSNIASLQQKDESIEASIESAKIDYGRKLYKGTLGNSLSDYAVTTSFIAIDPNRQKYAFLKIERPVTEGYSYRIGYATTDDITAVGKHLGIGRFHQLNVDTNGVKNKFVWALKDFSSASKAIEFVIFEVNNTTDQAKTISVDDFLHYGVCYGTTDIIDGVLDNLGIGDDIVSRNNDKMPMLVNSCRKGKSSGFKDIMFCCITDMHSERKANQNAIEATNGISLIDAYVNIGDIVGSNYSEEANRTAFAQDFAKLTKPGFVVIGNHDVGNCAYVGYACNHIQAYNSYIKPMVDNEVLVNGEYEAGKPYWYHDIATYKVRLIGLYEYDDNLDLDETYWRAVEYDSNAPIIAFNTSYNVGDKVNAHNYSEYSFECVQAVTTPANYYTTPYKLPSYKVMRGMRVIRQAQAQWFLDTLADTPADYGVIVLMHSAFGQDAESIEAKFSWPAHVYGRNTAQTSMATDFIRDALVAFKNGTAYTVKVVMSGSASYLNILNDGSIDYAYEISKDFSAKNSGVHLLGLIGGHTHRDLIWKDAVENIYMVNPNCAKVDGANDADGDVRRENHDCLSYDSLTIASFADGRIGLVKLGVNVTERGTFRDYEVIDTSV